MFRATTARGEKLGGKGQTNSITKKYIDHVYDGCELDDAESRIKVVKFVGRTM